MRLPIPIGLLLIAMGICCVAAAVEVAGAAPTIVTSADTEGHVRACQSCPGGAGNGGLARRATVLARLRASEPDLLLVDAGNALFGPDSAYSDGQVIFAGYTSLGYDALNLSYRDFRSGKAATLALLKDAKLPAVSCNLTDADSGKPLVLPYVVKRVGDLRVAMIGVTAVPDVKLLPRLAEQLKGITPLPPTDALGQWLGRAKAESDKIVLLYYGSASGLRPLLDRFANQLSAVAVGGMQPDELPAPTSGLPILLGQRHGTSLAKAALGANSAEQIVVASNVEPDPKMTALTARFEPAPPGNQPAVAAGSNSTKPPGPASPATEAIPPAPPPSQTTQVAVAPAPMKNVVPPAPATPEATKMADVPKPADVPKTPAAATPPVAAVPAPRPHGPARGIEGVGLTAEQVNAAIDRGAVGLWRLILKQDLTGDLNRFGDRREHILCALALVNADAHKKNPEFNAALRGYLVRVKPESLGGYENGLLCMLIQAYGDPAFDPKLNVAARYLVDAQGPEGTWNYTARLPADLFVAPGQKGVLQITGGAAPGTRGDEFGRLTDWKKESDGDNSVSQFALLGLQAASRTGINVWPEAWKRALAAARKRQCDDGGWNYHEHTANSYGSMTSAGICAVAICRNELGEPNPTDDPAIQRGLAWLDQNFTVDKHPKYGNGSEYLYYYLYSLERVGRILDTEFIGANEWYPQGAARLVQSQKDDGTWAAPAGLENDPRIASSFALLFLTRATPPLRLPQQHGPGTLRTAVVSTTSRFYIILDASGSMIDNMDGKLKFDIARSAVQVIIDSLSPDSEVALRVYGHRKRSIDPGADLDTELKIPMGKLDRDKFTQVLQSLRARGKTPLALSLEQTMQDLGQPSENDPVRVVLLTDGGEDTSKPRGNPLKAAEDFGKLKNVRLDIVGFDINQPDWSQQLQAMAQRSHARYWPAAREADLLRSVRAAVLGVPEQYLVLDKAGKEIAQGHFGDAQTLPEGEYQFRAIYAGRPFTQPFWINPQTTTAITFDATKAPAPSALPAEAAAPQPAAPPAQQPAPPAASTPKFCTHCGAPLKPGQKFCTNCGAKVGS